MKNKFLVFMFVFLAVFGVFSSVSASDWQPVNYSNPDLIKEAGLTIEEFNGLTQEDWLELLGDKEKVNFAFSATNSNGEDVTNERNQNIDINISGLNGSEVVKFENVENVENDLINKYNLNFNGSSEVIIPDSDSLNISNELTLEVWVNFNSTNQHSRFISKDVQSAVSGYAMGTRNEGELHFGIGSGGSPCSVRTIKKQNELSNKWIHITGVFDGEKLKIYINSILNNSISCSGTIATNNSDLILGSGYYYDHENYTGLLNEVRIWNKALTQEEIQNNMNKTLTGNEEGLVAYYDMEEGSGTTLIDKAGNNDGTIYGAEYILKE